MKHNKLKDILPDYILIDNMGSPIEYYLPTDRGYILFMASHKLFLSSGDDKIFQDRIVVGGFGAPIIFMQKKNYETRHMTNIELFELINLNYKNILRLKKLERITK